MTSEKLFSFPIFLQRIKLVLASFKYMLVIYCQYLNYWDKICCPFFWSIFSDQNILAVQKHNKECQECVTFDLKNRKVNVSSIHIVNPGRLIGRWHCSSVAPDLNMLPESYATLRKSLSSNLLIPLLPS